MDTSRKYLLIHNRREFHKTESSMQECQPSNSDTIGYSDSQASLVRQGFLPCRWCLSDITPMDMEVMRNKVLVHDTNEVG